MDSEVLAALCRRAGCGTLWPCLQCSVTDLAPLDLNGYVAAIELPVLVANGDSDPMILPRYSYLLAGLLPNARLTIYADSAHGFLFQHHSQFAADVNAFLDEPA